MPSATGVPESSSRTSSPEARSCSISRVEVGERRLRDRPPRSWRSWPSSSRTSPSASRAVAAIVASAPSVAAGSGCRVARAVGLGDHDRERVGDDVVHVARDAVALLLDDDFLLAAARSARARLHVP